MLIRNYLICSIFCLFLCNCKSENNYKNRYTLEKSDESIVINLNSNSTNKSVCIQYLLANDSNYLAILRNKYRAIELFNLDSKKLSRVTEIKKEGPNAFSTSYGFVMKNIDTMYVIGVSPQEVGVFTGNGEITRRIPYGKDSYGRRVNPSLSGLGSRPIIYGDSLFLVPAVTAGESSGIFNSSNQEHSSVSISINLNTFESRASTLKVPQEFIGKDITGINVWREIGNKNCFIYSFSLSDELFITYDHINFKKIPIETNYKFQLREDLSKYSSRGFNAAMEYIFSKDEVINILYDKFRSCYYIVVNKRISNFPKEVDYRLYGVYPSFFIIILDKNFKHEGEVYFPEDLYNCKMMFITKEGLYISEDNINNPSFNEDIMRFRLFTLEKL